MSILTDRNHHRYKVGSEVGRGGEGVVLEVVGHAQLLAKVYSSSSASAAARFAKLKYQCDFGDDELRRTAAWPRSLLFQDGAAVGFLMPRVSGKPIHQLYRPVDRKDHFPGVSWQGLIKVCQNIASAFHVLHSRSILMADVNESNVYVTESGEVRLIDCDSYQFTAPDGHVYGCDMGTPMWTPPELQGVNLGRCLRTEQHDLFGLAVLIFHVLFMGRHPFAGVPRTLAALENPPTIESNIRGKSFPFGRRIECDQGVPPHCLTLAALPMSLGALFEDAFLGAVRPTAADWYRQLGAIQFQACRWGHVFVRDLAECPWCQIWNGGGPNFFMASRLAMPAGDWVNEVEGLLAEIEAIESPVLKIDESAVASIVLHLWRVPARESLVPPASTPYPIQEPERRPEFGWGVLGLALCFVGILLVRSGIELFIAFGLLSVAMIVGGPKNPDFTREVQRRRSASSKAQSDVMGKYAELRSAELVWRGRFDQERARALKSIRDFEISVIAGWRARRHEVILTLKSITSELRALPSREKSMMDERRRRLQMDDYLRGHRISNQKILGIGPVRSALLAKYGIETAWDIKYMRYVPRLGQGSSSLRAWVAGIESRFVYNPRSPVSDHARQDILRDIAIIEDQLKRKFDEAAQGWMQFQRENNAARLQSILDQRVDVARRGVAETASSAKLANQQLLEQMGHALRAWGQAVANAAVCAV